MTHAERRRLSAVAPLMLEALGNCLAEANGALIYKKLPPNQRLNLEAIQECARTAIAQAKGETK